MVGHPSGPKADEIQSKIEKEHEMYGDILQVMNWIVFSFKHKLTNQKIFNRDPETIFTY